VTTPYVVTRGVYSDYHIVAIFSTRERAERFAAPLSGAHIPESEQMVIEEYELDPDVAPPRVGWRIHMDMTNGSLDADGIFNDVRFGELIGFPTRAYTQRIGPRSGQKRLVTEVECGFNEKERAIKVANERRVALIASGEGTP